jgi:hypothetical protein
MGATFYSVNISGIGIALPTAILPTANYFANCQLFCQLRAVAKALAAGDQL